MEYRTCDSGFRAAKPRGKTPLTQGGIPSPPYRDPCYGDANALAVWGRSWYIHHFRHL